MNILCIGNSFSEDACRYVHNMAVASGKDVTTLNLFIGGCSLEEHLYNIFFNKPYYRFEYNGVVNDDCKKGSIQEALCERDWDYISVQQCSPLCGNYDSYQPHLSRLVWRVHEVCPKAKIIVHQTWTWDPQSPRYPEVYENCDDMFKKLKDAYNKAADAIDAVLQVPCGEVLQALRYLPEFDTAKGGTPLHSDFHHMSEIYGRYAAAATWYQTLVGDIKECGFVPEGADQRLIEIINKTVAEICK